MGLYRVLLILYPASFRRQYGAEMLGVFARRRREAAGVLARRQELEVRAALGAGRERLMRQLARALRVDPMTVVRTE